MKPDTPAGQTPAMRSFGLNSREFYEAVCEPEARPWIAAGSLPREPRGREGAVVVEHRKQAARLDSATQS